MTNNEIDYAIGSQPFEGEEVSGDVGLIFFFDEKVFVAAIDVAGHGENAARIADRVKKFLERNYKMELLGLVQELHGQFKGTRGFAGSFGLLDLRTKILKFIGVGNVQARILGKNGKWFINRSGIIGYILPSLKEESIAMGDHDVLVLYSDGIKQHFQLEPWEDLTSLTAMSITDRIMRDFNKKTDDALCLTMKYGK